MSRFRVRVVAAAFSARAWSVWEASGAWEVEAVEWKSLVRPRIPLTSSIKTAKLRATAYGRRLNQLETGALGGGVDIRDSVPRIGVALMGGE